MHILILPSWYPTRDDPLSGSFFAEQAEALARHGHRVTVFPVYSDAPAGCRVEKTEKGALTEYAIHVKPLRFHLTYFRIVRVMAGLLRRELAGERPDVIHVHSFNAMKYARALKTLFGLPVVVTEHVTWFERGLLTEKQLASVTRDYAAADAIVTVSTGLREQICPYCGGREIRVIPNMVSEQFFQGALRNPPKGDPSFVSVGLLDHKKGFDILLRAFAEVRRAHPGTHLTICGGGEEREALERLAEELEIRENVTFTGNLSRQEVAQTLRENQIFVLPSRTETFGVVYVEAMACGLPIIMTKTNAWEMLALPETGVAVDIEDQAALTAAMLRMMEHYAEYDPARVAEVCRSRFSEEAVTAQLTALYESLLKK